MKVTKLCKGYRITVTDSEMELLRMLIDHGQADMDSDAYITNLSPGAKRAWKSARFQAIGGPLSIDNDHRTQ